MFARSASFAFAVGVALCGGDALPCSPARCRRALVTVPSDVAAPVFGLAVGTLPYSAGSASYEGHDLRLYASDGGELRLDAGVADQKWPQTMLLPETALIPGEQYRVEYNQPCPATLDVTGWQPTSFLFTPTGPSAWPEVFGSVALEGTQVTTIEVGGTGKCEPGSMEAAVATLSLFPHEQVKPFLANASLAVRGRWTPPGHLSAEGHVRPVQVDPLPHPPWRPEQIIHPCSSPHRWVGEVTVTVHIPGAPYDPVPGKVSLDFGCPGQVHPSETLPAAVDAGAATNDEPGGCGCTSSPAALNGLALVLLAVIGLRPHRGPRRAR